MRRRARRLLRHAAALLLAATLAAPELAWASEVIAPPKPLDAMSDAELDRYLQQINESANWRKYRRPNDPPDFVPGKPVRVLYGAGAALGRGGGNAARGFRRSGLNQRRSAIGSRSRRDEQAAMDRGRGSSRESSFGSSRSRNSSSRSSSGRSSFGSGNTFGNDGGFNQ